MGREKEPGKPHTYHHPQRSPARRFTDDHLLLAILGTAVGLAGLVVLIVASWGAGPVLAEVSWFQPMVTTFTSVTVLSVAFLSLGRYQVLHDPISFWIGMGFAAFGIGQVFFVLTWPGLLPDGRAIIARYTSTPAVITDLNLTILGVCLLAAVLARSPGGRRGLGPILTWLVFITSVYILIVSFEPYLPVLVRPDGTFTFPVLAWAAILLLLFSAGSVLSIRHYWRSGDPLAGYIAFSQMALVFSILMAIIGGKRYDLWWYLQRMILTGSSLVVLAGLLVENIHLLRRERELAHSLDVDRAQLAAVLENLPVGVWIADSRGRLIGKNPQADRIWAGKAPLSENQAEYSQFTAWYPGRDRPLLPEEYPLAQALRTGRSVEPVELRIHRMDGTDGTVLVSAAPIKDPSGQLTGAVGINLDVTERERAEQALRESEERFRQLADSMPQLVWTARPDGVVDYYNQRYREYDGVAAAGEGWQWSAALHPEDVQATTEAWKRSVETGEVYQIEHQVRMADGEYRWHLSRGVPIRDDRGRVLRWFGTATDIHDIKQAEQTLQKYNEELERSNRDLQEFAFVASHDLQEPLRKIEAFGDAVLEQSENLTERQRDLLRRMRTAANRMRSMVDGLLQLSRLTTRAQPFQRVSLGQITTEVLTDLERQIQRTGGVVEAKDLPVIEADPNQMRRLLQNLVSNALKFQPPDGTPRVTISCHQPNPAFVQIRVEDNGIGFDKAHAAHLFEPFKRLVGRTQYEGSGMGLAIARKIVERHGGSITAEGKPGQGAAFLVTLPVRQNHAK